MLLSSTPRPAHLAAACLLAAAVHAAAQPLPPSTAVPVVFTTSVAAGQARPGDPVRAKTIEAIVLPNGRVLPTGSSLTGHVVASTPFHFNVTPYAVQQPSILSVQFDTIAEAGAAFPITLALRALAGPVASHEAEIPHNQDEIDWSNTRVLIGGDSTSPLEKTLLSPDGATVGYNRQQGVFARLLTADSVNSSADLRCDGTTTEQAIGIFSPEACGIYGLNAVSLAGNGNSNDDTRGDGVFVLESRRQPVKLYAGTTALLEVIAR
ncbi:MAG TPA: hypothetical protein VGF88_10770 [Acidobacteriaceae bacterium]|jgi:hypothetical protein